MTNINDKKRQTRRRKIFCFCWLLCLTVIPRKADPVHWKTTYWHQFISLSAFCWGTAEFLNSQALAWTCLHTQMCKCKFEVTALLRESRVIRRSVRYTYLMRLFVAWDREQWKKVPAVWENTFISCGYLHSAVVSGIFAGGQCKVEDSSVTKHFSDALKDESMIHFVPSQSNCAITQKLSFSEVCSLKTHHQYSVEFSAIYFDILLHLIYWTQQAALFPTAV